MHTRPHRCIALAVAACLLAGHARTTAASAPAPDLSRGTRWVRTHPFTITGLCLYDDPPLDIERYVEAGFSSVLVWKAKPGVIGPTVAAGVPWHMHLRVGRQGRPRLNDELKAHIRALHARHPGGIAWIVNDEVKGAEPLRITREAMDWLRAEFPDMLVYSNANPLKPGGRDIRFIRNWQQSLEPDVLMFDLYPFIKDGSTLSNYFYNLATVRRVALEAGIPCWTFIQSFGGRVGFPERLPSESDLRMQLFASLTYGYTGVAYFMYEIHDHDHIRRALLYKCEPTRLYAAARKANGEVARLGRCLRALTSTDVGYLAASGNALPTGMSAWQPSEPIERIERTAAPEPDALVGRFVDDAGGRYFMLTNLAHGDGVSAEDARSGFRLKLAGDAPALFRLSRETGRAEPILPAGGGELTVSLPGGTGDLFRWVDADFAGLAQPQ